jgi:CheY-like chemotaxis protein
MEKTRILIVDDEPELQEVLGKYVRIVLGLEAVVAANGSEAIACLERERFDIILEDLQMPGIDGFTVLERACALHPDIFKIVLTGILDPAVTRRVEDMGAVFVAKPFEPKVLKLVIDQAFRDHPPLKEKANRK